MKFERVAPYEVGVDIRGVIDFLEAVKKRNIEMHDFMLIRKGKAVAEASWKPYSSDKLHMLFSLSKSFTSTAVGFAVQEGLLSIEDNVVSFFKDMLPAEPCEYMKEMKVKHLLTMNTGHSVEPPIFKDFKRDWLYDFLTSYVDKKPGTKFLYNTAGSYVLSCIVQKVTGENLVDYLKPRLFDPLGIEGVWWENSPQGIATGGFGLNVHIEDIARFGQFLLQKGSWEGKQLLNPEWIEAATSKQVENKNNDSEDEMNDWAQGYGYQFWRCVPEGVYRGDGAFGQFCIVVPDKEAVIAIQSTSDDMGGVMKELWTHVLPAMKEEVKEDKGAFAEYRKYVSNLMIPLPENSCTSVIGTNAAAFSGSYELSYNEVGLKEISFDFSGKEARVKISFDGYKDGIDAVVGNGYYAESPFKSEKPELPYIVYRSVASAGLWESDNVFKFTICYDETPFSDYMSAAFDDTGLIFKVQRNRSISETSKLTIFGRKK